MKAHVYFGSQLKGESVKLATFDTMQEGEIFVKKVVDAMNLKHSYLIKDVISENEVYYDYGHYIKFFIIRFENENIFK